MEGHGRHTLEDFSNGFPARAMGSEVEYTHPNSVMYPFTWRDSSLKISDYVSPNRLVSFGRNTRKSAIINTGGEIYIDGSFEYATPECRDPREVTIHERVGETAVMELIDNFCAREGSGIVKVFKRGGYPEVAPRNTGRIFTESPIGYHENYTSMNTFTGHKFEDRVDRMRNDINSKYLSDFLALRKLIDGAGMITNTGFLLSQKIPAVDMSYYCRPRTGTGKEPFMQKSSRLEVRSGEHSKSDWATAFTFGLTSLVVRLIEHGKYPESLSLRDPNQAVHALILNPHAHVALESGVYMKGLDVLHAIVETADQLGQQYPDEYPAYEQQAAQDFIAFYNDMQKVNLQDGEVKSLLRINWASRYNYFMRLGIEPGKFDASDPQQLAYDLVYDRIGDKDIARRILSKLGYSALHVDLNTPPETRAKSRVELARKAYDDGTLERADWSEVRIKDKERYILGGPLNQVVTQPIK
jgi:hypothetical protein